MPCPMYSTDREYKIEGRANAIPLFRVKAKKGQEKLSDTSTLQRAGLQSYEKSGQSQNSRFGAWQVGLQPCAPTGLHACIVVWGKWQQLCTLYQYHRKISSIFFLSSYVDSSKKPIWLSSFCNVFLKVC